MGIQEVLGLSDEEMIKPLPKPSKCSQHFWDSAKKHKLTLNQSKDCGHI